MKRKLIEFDVFERIKKDSLSTAQRELEEASSYLAKALKLESLSLNCYGPEDVIFESIDGSYVHANYKIDNGYIQFDNVQELIINEESERAKSHETLSEMLDCLIESNEQKAEGLFEEWMGLPGTKKIFTEARKKRVVPIRKNGKATGKYRIAYWNTTPKHHQSSSTKLKRSRGKIKANKMRSDSKRKSWAMNRKRAHAALGQMKEWHVIAENVFGYVDYYENGPVLQTSSAAKDDSGNVVAVRIPNQKIRNEAKVLQFNWKTMQTDVVVKRNSSKNISKDVNFAKEIDEIRKQNALSNDKGLQESVEKTAGNWPQVIYLTQSELSEQVKKALTFVGAKNYDDSTCEFIAEGLLRTAYDLFGERVSKIINLSGSKIAENANDRYSEFKNIVDSYYKNLDESTSLEMQVFVDLYEALRTIHEFAKEDENIEMATEASEYLDELLSVIKQDSKPSLELASEAASWLYDLVETNLEGSEWNDMAPVVSANGEHPDVSRKAKMSYTPASDFSGNYGSVPPASQGKGMDSSVADELANRGPSNEGGNDTYPSLDNPYLLKSGEYRIKGESDVDSDSGQLAHWGSSETWPNLQNPYVKAGSVGKDVE